MQFSAGIVENSMAISASIWSSNPKHPKDMISLYQRDDLFHHAYSSISYNNQNTDLTRVYYLWDNTERVDKEHTAHVHSGLSSTT